MNETIKLLREQKGYSQTYLAGCLQVSRQMYIKYETGEVEAPVKVVKALSRLYSVSYEMIIDDRLSPEKKNEVSYSLNHGDIMAASPETGYAAANENLQLTRLITEISKLPKRSLPSVSAFVHFLQQEEKEALNRKKDLHQEDNSKKSFFDLAGKISLDGDSVTAFREESLS